MVQRTTLVPGAAPAPRNHWYVAAFSHEVTQQPMAREILSQHLVFFRDGDGKARALDDRCPHRAVALSNGKIVDGTLQCFYHGNRYNGAGECVLIPSQTMISAKMRVRSYPIVEKWQWVWIWMGEAAAADPALIPDHAEFGLDGGDFHREAFFKMDIGGNYQLLHENLLDLSHISILHENSFDTGAIVRAKPTVSVQGDRIRIDREVEEVFTGAVAAIFELPQGSRMRRILRSESWAPSLNVVTNFFYDLQRPEAPPLVKYVVFPITPRDDRSCHYFTATAKNYGAAVHPPEAGQAVWEIFLADKAAIESIQRSYDLLGENTPDVSVQVDSAELRYRRILEEVLKRETDDAANNAKTVAAQ
jgi:vanillate O-demethylase monooxygenase subunit